MSSGLAQQGYDRSLSWAAFPDAEPTLGMQAGQNRNLLFIFVDKVEDGVGEPLRQSPPSLTIAPRPLLVPRSCRGSMEARSSGPVLPALEAGDLRVDADVVARFGGLPEAIRPWATRPEPTGFCANACWPNSPRRRVRRVQWLDPNRRTLVLRQPDLADVKINACPSLARLSRLR
jgi:hypothetical protein